VGAHLEAESVLHVHNALVVNEHGLASVPASLKEARRRRLLFKVDYMGVFRRREIAYEHL
jgi:hypothetical protein